MATSHQLAELEARTRRSRLLDPTERQQLEDLQRQPSLSAGERKKVIELLLLAASLAKTLRTEGIRESKETLMSELEPVRHISLVAALPERKDVVKASKTLESRGYVVARYSPSENFTGSPCELVVVYAPSLMAVQINKIKEAAKLVRLGCIEIRQEASHWTLPPPKPAPWEVVPKDTPDPPPSRKPASAVPPEHLPAFLAQVRRSLEQDLDWGEIVGAIQTWWSGEPPTGERLRQYIERLEASPEKLPASFREFWLSYKKKPEPAISEEQTPLEILSPPLSDSELQKLYEEAESTNQDLQAANTRLAKLQEELAAQLRQEQAATAAARQKAADHFHSLLAVRRETEQLKAEIQTLQGVLDRSVSVGVAKEEELEALRQQVANLEHTVERLSAAPPPLATPAHRILTKEGFAAAYAAYQMKVVLAEDLIRRIAQELGLLQEGAPGGLSFSSKILPLPGIRW